MRLDPEAESRIRQAERAEKKAAELEAEALIERARITGEPLRQKYVNRSAYRRALSKWKRKQ